MKNFIHPLFSTQIKQINENPKTYEVEQHNMKFSCTKLIIEADTTAPEEKMTFYSASQDMLLPDLWKRTILKYDTTHRMYYHVYIKQKLLSASLNQWYISSDQIIEKKNITYNRNLPKYVVLHKDSHISHNSSHLQKSSYLIIDFSVLCSILLNKFIKNTYVVIQEIHKKQAVLDTQFTWENTLFIHSPDIFLKKSNKISSKSHLTLSHILKTLYFTLGNEICFIDLIGKNQKIQLLDHVVLFNILEDSHKTFEIIKYLQYTYENIERTRLYMRSINKNYLSL